VSDQTPALQLPVGWLPIAIDFDPRPSIMPHAPVRWMEFGSSPLDEPFVAHSIKRLRAGSPPAREIETDLDTLLRVGGKLPAVQPAGFIFHISRCGSTLVANALKTAEGALVVSESPPLTSLLLPEPESFGAYVGARWERLRRNTLQSLFSLFAHYRTGEAERLVIKFASVNTLSMRVVRACFPGVPCLIVVRDPAEVMVASLRGGGWMSFKSSPEVARRIFGWPEEVRSCAEMSDEEYGARVLGRYLSSALDAFDQRCMVVDYEDLNQKRMREIAAFFGLVIPETGKDLEAVFGFYAKDPARRLRFKDDRREKQKQMSAALRTAARQWARTTYFELRSRC
jgi:hypothetical protein